MRPELISVIVPAYNVEDYLARCLDSILNQKFEDYRIILVDDGSTDKTQYIAKDYARNYPAKIKLIQQRNKGLSAARNAGIDAAEGKYICFVDSDDVVSENYLSSMYHSIDYYQVDMIICKLMEFSTKNCNFPTDEKGRAVIKTKQYLYNVLSDVTHSEIVRVVTACNKLYARHLFDNIRYPEGKLHEDEFVIHHIIDAAHGIMYLEETHYGYYQRRGSITSFEEFYNPKHLDVCEAFLDRYDFFKKKLDEKYIIQMMYAVIEMYINQYFNGASDEYGKTIQKKVKDFMAVHKKEISFKKSMRYNMFLKMPGSYYKRYYENCEIEDEFEW